MEFIKQQAKTTPGDEQETVLIYDKHLNEWSIGTNNPVHARKWERLVKPSETCDSRKVYNKDTGQLIGLYGAIDGTVSVRQKVKSTMTPEQRAEASKRMKELHAKRKN